MMHVFFNVGSLKLMITYDIEDLKIKFLLKFCKPNFVGNAVQPINANLIAKTGV